MHLSKLREYTYRHFTNRNLFVIWFYHLSRFSVTILEHIIISMSFYFIISTLYLILVMASMDITESGFQTPASKKEKDF